MKSNAVGPLCALSVGLAIGLSVALAAAPARGQGAPPAPAPAPTAPPPPAAPAPAAPDPAAPAPSATPGPSADQLLAEGRAALEAGRIDEACQKLERSVAARRDSEALLASGQCHELQGKTASAFAEYTEASLAAGREGVLDRQDRARSMASQLAPRLSKLRIDVQAPRDGQSVRRNGATIDRAVWGSLVPVDPGAYSIASSAPGVPDFTLGVTIGAQSDVRVVVIPPLGSAASLQGGAGLPPKPGAPLAPGASKDTPLRKVSPIGVGAFVTTSFGVLGLAMGTVFGVMALNEAGSAEEDPALCPDKKCSPAGMAVIDEARTKGVVATVCLSTGGASLATGIILFLVKEFSNIDKDPAKEKLGKRADAWSIEPVVGFGYGGATVRF